MSIVILENGQKMQETYIGNTKILTPYIEETQPQQEIISEPVDEEKAFLADAIIQMSALIETMQQEINTLKGGN